MTRRDLGLLLPALGFLSAAMEAPGEEAGQLLPAHSRAFAFEELPVRRSSGGAATRPVLRGKLPTGEAVELHETTLMPGQMPHPAHRHVHTELMLIREGTVQFILSDGAHPIGPGGVAYAASGEMHGLKNTGTAPATYYVIAIGTDPPQA